MRARTNASCACMRPIPTQVRRMTERLLTQPRAGPMGTLIPSLPSRARRSRQQCARSLSSLQCSAPTSRTCPCVTRSRQLRHTRAHTTSHWQWLPAWAHRIAQPPAAVGASGTVPRTEQLAVHRRWVVGCADVCGDIPDQAPVGGRALGASIIAPTNAVLRLNKKPNPHGRGEAFHAQSC
jgi:hypothetical protein